MPREYRDQLVKLFEDDTASKRDAIHPTGAQELMVLSLIEGLGEHGASLKAAAEASDKYARSLVRATWSLVAATVALVLATVALIMVTWYRG